MRKLLIVGIVAVFTVLAAGSANAGSIALDVTGDFAPGGTITVSGIECTSTDGTGTEVPQSEVEIEIFGGDPVTVVGTGGVQVVPVDGSWSTLITIADTAQPGVEYTIDAHCDRVSLGDPASFSYPALVMTMGEPVTPPSSDTTSSTDASTSGDDPGTAATAAAPASNPRFTG
jgi:hypothetical protein